MKFGRYFNSSAALRTRSWVLCGMDLAAGDRLITRETVAGESCRCSARNFRLTDCAEVPPRGRKTASVLGRFMGCSMRVVWHSELSRATGNARLFSRFGSLLYHFPPP